MGMQGRIDFIKRNEMEEYLKKQIKKIERRIYSIFSVDKDETLDFSLSIAALYRNILQRLLFLDLEETDSFQKVLLTITKMFLEDLESHELGKYPEFPRSGLFNDFSVKIDSFIDNYNKKHAKELREELGIDMLDERIPDEIAFRKIFDKIIDNVKNERKKKD